MEREKLEGLKKTLGKGKTEDAVMLALMQTSNVLFKQGEMDGRELIDNYLIAAEIESAHISAESLFTL